MNNNHWDLRNALILSIIAAVIAGLILFAYNQYIVNRTEKIHIDSVLQKADSLKNEGNYEKAINEYEDLLKRISSKEFHQKNFQQNTRPRRITWEKRTGI